MIPHLGASTEESEDNCAVMAVKQLKDYLENVILKTLLISQLRCRGFTTAGRIAILHKNILNMLTQFTGAFSAVDINITDLVNKSKGDYAYTVIDVESSDNRAVVEKLAKIKGVLKVRIVK